MYAYTDYPLISMGDKPNKPAPMRRVELISYDGDKYCMVRIGKNIFEIKTGYLYTCQCIQGKIPYVGAKVLSALPKT